MAINIEIKAGTYNLVVMIDGEVTVTGFEGAGSRLIIPESIEVDGQNMCITHIAPKAFFANKELQQAYLPASVTHIGDWAFASCENLKEFTCLNRGAMSSLGRGVFDNCHRIENVLVGYEEKDDLSALMAAIIDRMPAEYLLRDEDIGNDNWFLKWDQCLSTYLNEPDIDGYTDLVLCGEEDIFYNEPDFAMNKRRKKCSLCMLRLIYSSAISEETRKKYTDYILSHNKGCETEEAWDEILANHGEDTAYYKLLFDIGGIKKDNIDDMLEDMGEYHAEAKAYMLAIKQEHFSVADFFDEFEL